LGLMSFFVKACVEALKAVPVVNGRIDGDDFVQNNFYDIGVAVGTERGLVVPVMRDADKKRFADLERTTADYASRAREGKRKTKNCLLVMRNIPTPPGMNRIDGRTSEQLRPVSFDLGIAPYAGGSVLVTMGNTRVICGVTVEENVPRWMKEQGVTGGWVTAEYSMLPYSTQTRKPRDIAKGRIDGRSMEIQRLIGRSLRAVVDLEKLGPRTIWVDCDVLQADGGTRTTAITGASLALAIACRKFVKEEKLDAPPMQRLVAAVSAGILQGEALLDLNYDEDKVVAVDF